MLNFEGQILRKFVSRVSNKQSFAVYFEIIGKKVQESALNTCS